MNDQVAHLKTQTKIIKPTHRPNEIETSNTFFEIVKIGLNFFVVGRNDNIIRFFFHNLLHHLSVLTIQQTTFFI